MSAFAGVAKNYEKGNNTILEHLLQGFPYWGHGEEKNPSSQKFAYSHQKKSPSRLPHQIFNPIYPKQQFFFNLTKETSCLAVIIAAALMFLL